MNFYSHLIEIDSIIIELDKMDLSGEQKHHLAELLDSSLHHTILDAILSELKEDDKKVFLKHVDEGDNEKIWEFLNGKVDHIEEKIKKAADQLKVELHKDIDRSWKKEAKKHG